MRHRASSHKLPGVHFDPGAAPPGAGASLGLHARARPCCGAKQVPETLPWGPLTLQVAPLASDLQAASASGGGPLRSLPEGCAEAALTTIIETMLASPTGAKAVSSMVFNWVFFIVCFMEIPG